MDSFLGEVRLCAFGFTPQGWAQCNGQLLSIQQNQALYTLLGTAFGGNGSTHFALPDLRGRVGVGPDAAFGRGKAGGAETVTLTEVQIPTHSHVVHATTNLADLPSPNSGIFAATDPAKNCPIYAAAENLVTLAPGTIAKSKGGQPHSNLQPSLALNYVICLQGSWPPRPD